MKKRIVSLLMVVLFSTYLVFAESKTFYTVGASGSTSTAIVKIDDSYSKGVSASASAHFSTGFENEKYNFTISEDVGLGGFSGSLSYTSFFKNAMFATIELGAGVMSNYGFSFAGALGVSLIGVNNICMNLGLAMEVDYQHDTTEKTSILLGMLGIVMEDIIPITDSLSLNIGLTFAGLPLFAKFYTDTGDSISMKYSGFALTLRTGVKYSIPTNKEITPHLNTR